MNDSFRIDLYDLKIRNMIFQTTINLDEFSIIKTTLRISFESISFRSDHRSAHQTYSRWCIMIHNVCKWHYATWRVKERNEHKVRIIDRHSNPHDLTLIKVKPNIWNANLIKEGTHCTAVMLNGQPIPVRDQFKYLASDIQTETEIKEDVNHRINAYWLKWRCNENITWSGYTYKTKK